MVSAVPVRMSSKTTKTQVEGSPARALKISPPFDGFHFIDMNPRKTSYLQTLCEGRSGVQIYTGDSSAFLIKHSVADYPIQEFQPRALPARSLRAASGLGGNAPRRSVASGRYVLEFPSHGHEPQRHLAEPGESATGWHRPNETGFGVTNRGVQRLTSRASRQACLGLNRRS